MILKKFEKGGKTVSQIWEEKTGTAWAEARKQGVSDGTYASNMALRKSLLDGTFSKDKKVAPKELNLKKEMSIVDKDYDGPTEFPKKEESTQKSFSQAFLKARQESLDTFQWNGKSYTTKIKGEDTPKKDAKVNTTEEVKPAEGLTEGAAKPKPAPGYNWPSHEELAAAKPKQIASEQPTVPKAPAPYAGYNYPSFGTKQPTTTEQAINKEDGRSNLDRDKIEKIKKYYGSMDKEYLKRVQNPKQRYNNILVPKEQRGENIPDSEYRFPSDIKIKPLLAGLVPGFMTQYSPASQSRRGMEKASPEFKTAIDELVKDGTNSTTTPKKAPYITADQDAIRSALKAALRLVTPFNSTTKI